MLRLALVLLVACSAPPRAKQTEPAPTVAPAPRAAPTEPAWTPPDAQPPIAPPTAVAAATPERCAIRLTARGIFVDGDPMQRAQAIARCKQRTGALVELAADADAAAWTELRAALVAAGVEVLMRGERNDKICLDNPLAKGCN
jgi:hypothetical protein